MTWLCSTCRANIGHFPLSCIVCDTPQARGVTCLACTNATSLTGVVSVGSYRSVLLQRGIGWLKFKSIKPLAEPLAELLLPTLGSIAPIAQLRTYAALVPIPLHRKRLRERGFNQSEEIAQHLSRFTGIPVATIITRQKSTFTQSHLPPELRQQNVADAFRIRVASPPPYRLALVIDDVTTSGSTLNAAATTLRQAGIPTVWGCAIARG